MLNQRTVRFKLAAARGFGKSCVLGVSASSSRTEAPSQGHRMVVMTESKLAGGG